MYSSYVMCKKHPIFQLMYQEKIINQFVNKTKLCATTWLNKICRNKEHGNLCKNEN
jgi:hypothetical protein